MHIHCETFGGRFSPQVLSFYSTESTLFFFISFSSFLEGLFLISQQEILAPILPRAFYHLWLLPRARCSQPAEALQTGALHEYFLCFLSFGHHAPCHRPFCRRPEVGGYGVFLCVCTGNHDRGCRARAMETHPGASRKWNPVAMAEDRRLSLGDRVAWGYFVLVSRPATSNG